MLDLIILGAGPAGIFAAITYKTRFPDSSILILESTDSPLSKILISGGGRCNLTNATFDPKDLVKNYPRGEKELLGPFYIFQPKDIMSFFEMRNIKLKVEKDGRVFPFSNKAATIKDCLLSELAKLKIEIELNSNILSLKKGSFFSLTGDKKTYDSKSLLLATGSSRKGFAFAKELGHSIQSPLPSLFAFDITPPLGDLSGVSLNASMRIQDSSFSETGALLITHRGFSGPLVLKLSSLAARHIHEKPKPLLEINWILISEEEAFSKLLNFKKNEASKTLLSQNIFSLPQRLWRKFLELHNLIKPLEHISKMDLSKFAHALTHDHYLFSGKSQNKNEFVTCGGVCLNEVNFKTMESKICPNLYFAGEILDIDGLTGGYNFQNAWTTGFIAGSMIS